MNDFFCLSPSPDFLGFRLKKSLRREKLGELVVNVTQVSDVIIEFRQTTSPLQQRDDDRDATE